MSRASGKAPEQFGADRRKKESAVVERAEKRAARAEQKQQLGDEFKLRGNNFYKEGDYEEAIHNWVHAIEVNGTQPAYMSNLAAAFLKLERYDEAEKVANEALRYDPMFLKARFRRAMARKGSNLLKAAIADLESILKIDPQNADALSELTSMRTRCEQGEGEETGNTTSDDEYPGPEDDKWEIGSISDSSDCFHQGNGIPCRFYNRDSCAKGDACAYSHAPDDKSMRDKLGRNVCVFYLMHGCKFGSEKCYYAHDKTYLREDGWWNDRESLQALKDVFNECAQYSRSAASRFDRGSYNNRHVNQADSSRGHGGRKSNELRMAGASNQVGSSRSGGRERGRRSGRRRGARLSNWERAIERELDERMLNYGYTEDELEDLLCQGIKPWDEF